MLSLSIIGITKSFAYDFSAVCETGQTLYYNITNAEYHYVELTYPNNTTNGSVGWDGYEKPTGNIILPKYVYDANDDQYCVIAIGYYAFYGCSGLTGELTIPNSVTRIRNNAFYGCGGFTGNLTISNSVTLIDAYAFFGCNGFTGSLTIPNSVTTIGQYAFCGCSGFTGDLIMPNSMSSPISPYTFSGCSGFTGGLTIPNSIPCIGESAFFGCNGFSGDLTIPNSVTLIDRNAFSGCSGFTGDLTIPNSLNYLGVCAFRNCSSFEHIVVESSNSFFDSRGNCNALIETESNNLIIGCKNTIIPNSVTSIDNYAFYNCSGLVGNLTIPDSVISIGTWAFFRCDGLSSITLGNSLATIGMQAFYGCTGFMGDLTIPNSVTTIGNGAFQGCSGFTGTLTIGNSVITIGNSAFENCSSFTEVYFNATDCADANVDYPPFRGCTGLLYIGENVEGIPQHMFQESAFSGSLTIPNSVILIGNAAFSGCQGITLLKIGNSVTNIGDYAFLGCHGITSLTIGNSVSTIGNYAFSSCSGLSSITMLAINPSSLGNNALNWTSNTLTIYVPYESLETYKTAINWSDYQSRIYPWLQKSISGYGTSAGSWYFIASPVLSSISPINVDNMISETEYDLYRFNQSAELEWENYKNPVHTEGFTINNGKGYLYASEEDVNLMFKGVFNEFDERMVSLTYDTGKPLAGWNLVGNPFPFNAYANRSYYVMNEEGTAIEPIAVSSLTAIEPCTGILVKADEVGESVTFTKSTRLAEADGLLQITVAESTRSNTIEDKAIVSFNEGDALGKFVFNKDNAQISIPQGKEDFAIAFSDMQGEMPLNFKANKQGEYTITVNPEDVEMEYLHLIDNMTGADVDLLALAKAQQPTSYTFTANTMDYPSRFRLVFCKDGQDSPATSTEPFAYCNGNEWNVSNSGQAVLQVVDALGHVLSTNCINGNATLSMGNLANGVYVLRLINNESVKTQKIVVK